MIDEGLSAAVIAYVWGVPSKSWPTCQVSSLSEQQQRFLSAVEAAERTANSVPPDWPDIPTGHRLVTEAVTREHPELSADAVAALANAYCFGWK